jgi:hypothetical protein
MPKYRCENYNRCKVVGCSHYKQHERNNICNHECSSLNVGAMRMSVCRPVKRVVKKKKELYKECIFVTDCKNRNRGQVPPCAKKVKRKECIICGGDYDNLNLFQLCSKCAKNGIDNSGM